MENQTPKSLQLEEVNQLIGELLVSSRILQKEIIYWKGMYEEVKANLRKSEDEIKRLNERIENYKKLQVGSKE